MITTCLDGKKKVNSNVLTISNLNPFIHEDAALILQKSKNVSSDLGIILDDLYEDHTTMTNHLYIGAPVERMVHAVVSYDVFYYLDDLYGEDTKSHTSLDFARVLDAWMGKSSSDISNVDVKTDILYNAIEYIGSIIRENAPPSFFEQYTSSVLRHLNASLEEEKYLTVDEYIEIRKLTGGMEPVIDLIEFTYDFYLTETIYHALPRLKEVQECCVLIGALSNDLFSYAKEKHSAYNLVNAFLLTEEASEFDEAVEKSIERVNKLHLDYTIAMEACRIDLMELSAADQTIARQYLKAMDIILSACYHWQKSTSRYVHENNVFEDMRPV